MTEYLQIMEPLDQIPHSAAYDLGLHCLPITLLGVSRLQWVKALSRIVEDGILFFYYYYYFSEKKRLDISHELVCLVPLVVAQTGLYKQYRTKECDILSGPILFVTHP